MPRRWTLLLTLAVVATGWVPDARADETETVSDAPSEPRTTRPFLRLESSFWAAYGVRVVGHENDVPGFLVAGLADAVAGSPEAERHASHAKVWSILNLSFAVSLAALASVDIVLRLNDSPNGMDGWPDFVPTEPSEGRSVRRAILGAGWLVSLVAGIVSRYMAYEEIMLSINSYNYDFFGKEPATTSIRF